MSNLSGKTTIVVGASRGLGHGIATALAAAGARVVAVSRTAAAFPKRANGSATIQLEVADAGGYSCIRVGSSIRGAREPAAERRRHQI